MRGGLRKKAAPVFHRGKPAEGHASIALLHVTTGDVYAEERPGFFCRVHFVGLAGLCRVVIAPEPSHLRGEFCRAVACIVGTLAKAEMKIVVLQLEGVGHTDIG